MQVNIIMHIYVYKLVNISIFILNVIQNYAHILLHLMTFIYWRHVKTINGAQIKH